MDAIRASAAAFPDPGRFDRYRWVDGDKVRRCRHARGLSQVKLAVTSGLSLTAVGRAEGGRATLRTLKRLALALTLPPSELEVAEPDDAAPPPAEPETRGDHL